MSHETHIPEELQHLFRLKPRSNHGGEVIVGALRFADFPKEKVAVTSLSWGNMLLARLRLLGETANESEKDLGRMLPYASLRAAMQVKAKDAIYIDNECGAFWKEKPRPIMASTGKREDIIDATRLAVRTWADLVLVPWAENTEVDEDLVESIRSALDEDSAFITKGTTLTGQDVRLEDFKDVRDYLLRFVSKKLVGQELFDGLGPVARIIRARADSNLLEFQTWPIEVKGAAFSMVAEVSLETMPGDTMPFLKVRATRRRWVKSVPPAGTLSWTRFRRLSPYVMTKDFLDVAVTTSVELKNGEPKEVLDPACILHGLQSLHAMPHGDLRKQVEQTASGLGDVFIGVPHATAFGGHPIGSGVSYRDNLDLIERIGDLLANLNVQPSPFRAIERILERGVEGHAKISTDTLFYHIAGSINEGFADGDVEAALELLAEKLPVETVTLSIKHKKAIEDLRVMREANKVRVEESYKNRPIINVVARTAQEREFLQLAVECLFGDAVRIGNGYQLPANAHGPRSDFPDIAGFRERFAKRYEIWTPLAQEVGKQANHSAHVLVQAANIYEGGKDDPVSKPAGRAAFAREARSNSQWLLPMDGNKEGSLSKYLFRVQSAIYDLLLGHSGCVDPINDQLMDAFEDPSSRPKCVIGITVINLARQKRGGGRGGKLAVALKITPDNRATLTRATWKDGLPYDRGGWLPLNEFLTDITNYPGVSIGDNRNEEGVMFQQFVKDVIDESADNSEKPFVMIDGTNARDLWPTLTNGALQEKLEFHALPDGIVDDVAWRDVRIVRVDRTAAGIIALKKIRTFDELEPDNNWNISGNEVEVPAGTSGRELVKLAEWLSGGLYWASGGRDSVLKRVRGDRSVYRDLTNMIGVARDKIDEVYDDGPECKVYKLSTTGNAALTEDAQMPSTLEIAVIKTAKDDDEDRLAEFVDCLRKGYGHHGSVTALPAPLSFDLKVKDYIARFTFSDEELAQPVPEPDQHARDQGEEEEDFEDEESSPTSVDRLSLKSKLMSSVSFSGVLDMPGLIRQEEMEDASKPEEKAEMNKSDLDKARAHTGGLSENLELPERQGELPSFVDPDWVLKYIYLPDRLKNAARVHADEIAIISGFDGWPKEKSAHGKNKSVKYILEGIHFPLFLPALYKACGKKLGLSENNKLSDNYVVSIVQSVFDELRDIIDDRDLADVGGGRWIVTAIRRCLDKGAFDFVQTFVFHLSVCDIGAWDGESVIECLEQYRDSFEHQKDLDIVIEFARQRCATEESIDIAEDVLTKWSQGNVLKLDEDTTPRDRWSRAVGRLKMIVDDLSIPEAKGVDEIQDVVNDLRSILDEVEEEAIVDISGFTGRLIHCRNGFVEIAGRRMEEKWQGIADAVDSCPDAVEVDFDVNQMEANVGALEECLEAVASAELARKTAHQLDDEYEREDATIAAVANLKGMLQIAFEHMFEALEYIGQFGAEDRDAKQDQAEPQEELEESEDESDKDLLVDDDFDDADEEGDQSVEEEVEKAGIVEDLGQQDAATVPESDFYEEPEEEWLIEDNEGAKTASGFTSDDPRIAEINNRLDELYAASEFGLAYHLVTSAEQAYPGTSFHYTGEELLLTACSNFTTPPSLSEAKGFKDALNVAANIANDLEMEGTDDRTTARRIALFASAIELALFEGVTNMTAVNITKRLQNGAGNAFYTLSEVVQENVKFGSKLTANAVFSLASPEDKSYANNLRQTINSKLDVMESSQRPYKVGRQVQSWLMKKGPLGDIRTAVNGTVDTAKLATTAKAIASKYIDEESANEVIEKAEDAEQTYRPVIGDGRHWFIHNITEICSLTVKWADVILRDTPTSSDEQTLRRLSGMITKGLANAKKGLDELKSKHGDLVRAAADMTEKVFHRLDGLTVGKTSPKTNSIRAMVALHAALPWVRGLSYAGEWVPSPYQPDVIVAKLLSGDLTFREQRHAVNNIDEAINQHIQDGSFIAARLLVVAAEHYEIDEVQRNSWVAKIDHELENRKKIVKEELEDTQIAVINSQRYTISRNETLQAAFDTLEQTKEAIDGEGYHIGDNVAPIVSFDLRDLVTERDEIRDVIAIENLIKDILSQIEANYETEKQPIIAKLDSLNAILSDEEYGAAKKKIIRLIDEEKDLATALELLDYYVHGGDQQHRRIRNPDDFNEFYFELDVPSILEKSKDYGLDEIRAAIANGEDYRGIPFSRVEDKEVADDILQIWTDLRRAVQQSNSLPEHVIALTASLFETAGFRDVVVVPDKVKSAGKVKKEIVADLEIEVPRDSESILLPDFGSSTHGSWRLVVSQKMPDKARIERLIADVSNFGVMVILPNAVKKQEWEKRAENNIANAQKILIIDEGIFLYALSKPRFRALTLIEIAQAFSYAEPYKDHGNSAVYPEMFKGRRDEYRILHSLNSGFLVYGGRRLGKTALLRYFVAEENKKDNNIDCAYIDLQDATDTKAIWERGSAELKGVFERPVDDFRRFSNHVKTWLEKDSRRRIILLVDECDETVKTDEEKDFQTIRAISQLMGATGRRFKVVLAGRQNILRFRKDMENAPLTHMDSGVLPIGPMINKDVPDAETLITAPLAGMGYTFKDSKDVWRILSFCNYYPIMIQHVGEELVSAIRDRVSKRKEVKREIDSELVSEVLKLPKTLNLIGQSFNKTLELDGRRYELLTYIVAENMIEQTDAGHKEEGMSADQILNHAAIYWPAAFGDDITLDAVIGLLEEMEVLGLLRKVAGVKRWTLRSRSTLNFIGGHQRVDEGVSEFVDRPTPQILENTSKRRVLTNQIKRSGANLIRSVLTIGQEAEIIQNRSTRPMIVWGNDSGNINAVVECLKKLETEDLQITLLKSTSQQALRNELANLRPSEDMQKILVVPPDKDWDNGWVSQTTRSRIVQNGAVKVIFIGGVEKVASWVGTDMEARTEINTISLQPWRKSFISAILHYGLVDNPDRKTNELFNVTGGWSRLIDPAMGEKASNKTVDDAIQKLRKKIEGDRDEICRGLGLVGEWKAGARYILDFDAKTDKDFIECLQLAEEEGAISVSPGTIIEYLEMLRLIEQAPAIKDEIRSGVQYRLKLNPLVAKLLAQNKE